MRGRFCHRRIRTLKLNLIVRTLINGIDSMTIYATTHGLVRIRITVENRIVTVDSFRHGRRKRTTTGSKARGRTPVLSTNVCRRRPCYQCPARRVGVLITDENVKKSPSRKPVVCLAGGRVVLKKLLIVREHAKVGGI